MKLKEIIDVSIKNILSDREDASELLGDVSAHIGTQPDLHSEYGMVAAKYLEIMLKSNEQLIKLLEQVRKDGSGDYGDMSDEEKDDMYDEIENDDIDNDTQGDEEDKGDE